MIINENNTAVDKDSTELRQQDRQKKEYKLIDSIKPHKGHEIYEIVLDTLEVRVPEYKKSVTVTWEEAKRLVSQNSYKKEIVVKTGCAYISALNKKKAIDRFKKNKGSATLPTEGFLKLI